MFLTFFKLKERITDEIPTKMKENAVSVTSDIPEKIGFANNRKERIIPNILVKARLPQFGIPASFKSNEIPNK